MENKIYTCLIIGSGPCGIGAAISLKQSGFEDFAIIEKSTPGGKVNIAPRVDNYPGFKKIPGPDLAYELYKRTLVHAVPIKVNKDEIGKIVLPVPSIEDQKKIISKLDRFESLTESISIGLPAEIELRRKQYEYYRNKLLSFEELSVSE